MKRRLLLLTFLMLFTELALIRWLGSNVVYLSYFTNFVLLGSFLGIGAGFLLAKSRANLWPWMPVMLALLVGMVLATQVTVRCVGIQVLYSGFGCATQGAPMWVILPLIFIAVAAVMASIAQAVARAFGNFRPLDAYRLDILGSMAGIAAFTGLSYLGAPPVAWGAVVLLAFVSLHRRPLKLVQIIALAATIVILGKESIQPGDVWSPYYKISVFGGPDVYFLNVNGIPHQLIEPTSMRLKYDTIYVKPYQHIKTNPLRNVLIVGAGNGADVAIALRAGAKHVDAVEIDPRIYRIGQAMNPDHPYQDPRVDIHIDDGRAFLERTHGRYDLILFALPDSLALVSGQSSLRLESYLFTVEAMKAARAHLNAGGAFALYNFYRETWLLDRLAHTLETTYGHRPCVDAIGGSGAGRFSLLLVGLGAADASCATTWNPGGRAIPPPVSDDRPFPYLQSRAIPHLYLVAIAAILSLSFLVVRVTTGPLVQMRGYLDLFFMGSAFLLLETKNVVQFALLFGTTWIVNALVFFGILCAVLMAVEVSRRIRIGNRAGLYAALFLSLILAAVIQPGTLLALDTETRFFAAVALAFTPVFFANLIFADRFREVDSSTIAFGANLLGAMVGGLLEYSSLITGYRGLIPLVGGLYALALIFDWKSRGLKLGLGIAGEPLPPASVREAIPT